MKTLLVGGVSTTHDALLAAALRSRGLSAEPVGTPEASALREGRRLLSRGHCNPTYYLAGALVERLRRTAYDSPGERFAHLTVGSCGPCRFATYAAEYRRALAAAHFGDVEVVVIDQLNPRTPAALAKLGVQLDASLFAQLGRAVVVGDLLGRAACEAHGRGAEPERVQTVVARAREELGERISARRAIVPALRRLRDDLAALADRVVRPRTRVRLIGEFFAATTDGDGGYRLVRWLEERGAMVEPPAVTEWLLYLAWQVRSDTTRRLPLYRPDPGPRGLLGKMGARIERRAIGIERSLRALYGRLAREAGVCAPLLEMDDLAELARPHYRPELRAGMGHLEVGTFLAMDRDRRADLVISIKPFGCLPSSAVSDGVLQVLARQARHAAFVAVETTGDAEALVESRLELALELAARPHA